MQKTISFMQEEGSIFGYAISSKEENLRNYLDKFGDSLEICNLIRSKYLTVAILSNLFVEEEYRGNGIGSQLLEKFIEESFHLAVDAIIVIPDVFDENSFNIKDWYENSYDFEIVYQLSSYPVMIKTYN